MAKPVMERNTLETILVVEDQAPVLQAVCAILERAGFCMLAARQWRAGNSGEEYHQGNEENGVPGLRRVPLQAAQSSQREWGLALQ